MQPNTPETFSLEIAPDTHLITHLAPGGPDIWVPMNSYAILGSEPVIVDTGAHAFRDEFFDQIEKLVDLEDVRWIFISHDDQDHVGNLHELLERAPAAKVVTNFFINERMSVERHPIPIERQMWLEDGDSFRAGDRTLRLFTPTVFDGVTTRGLFDESTGAMWTVDSFAAFTPGAVHHAAQIPTEMYDESFDLFSSMISPWHQWLDVERFGKHVNRIQSLGALTVASSHGPVLTGDYIGDAYERVRRLAGEPRLAPPGPEVLDQLITMALASLEESNVVGVGDDLVEV